MMAEKLTQEQVEYLVKRLLDNAATVKKEREEKQTEDNKQYYDGLMEAYYEMLDTLKNQLLVYDQDLAAFGLDMDLEKELV